VKEVTNVEVAEVLEAAADLYESGALRWRQGAYGSGQDRCFIGALDVAAVKVGGNVKVDGMVHPRVDTVIISRIGTNIPDWNDHPERTLDQVIELLKTTAKDLRNAQ
jgi:hypothetical protein